MMSAVDMNGHTHPSRVRLLAYLLTSVILNFQISECSTTTISPTPTVTSYILTSTNVYNSTPYSPTMTIGLSTAEDSGFTTMTISINDSVGESMTLSTFSVASSGDEMLTSHNQGIFSSTDSYSSEVMFTTADRVYDESTQHVSASNLQSSLADVKSSVLGTEDIFSSSTLSVDASGHMSSVTLESLSMHPSYMTSIKQMSTAFITGTQVEESSAQSSVILSENVATTSTWSTDLESTMYSGIATSGAVDFSSTDMMTSSFDVGDVMTSSFDVGGEMTSSFDVGGVMTSASDMHTSLPIHSIQPSLSDISQSLEGSGEALISMSSEPAIVTGLPSADIQSTASIEHTTVTHYSSSISPSPSSTIVVMSSQILVTSSITTQPTLPTTTTPPKPTAEYPSMPGNTETAMFHIFFDLSFYCSGFNKETIIKNFTDHSALQSVTLTAKQGSGCSGSQTRRKRRDDTVGNYTVSITIPIRRASSAVNETRNVVQSMRNDHIITGSTNIDSIVDSMQAVIDDVCLAAGYCTLPYKCRDTSKRVAQPLCYFLCRSDVFSEAPSCTSRGQCYVEFDHITNSHVTKCSCDQDVFYEYGGDDCETTKMTWQMVLAITGGCAGVVIIILVFVIVVICVTKHRKRPYHQHSNGVMDYNELLGARQRSTPLYECIDTDQRITPGQNQTYDNGAYQNRDYIEPDSDIHYRSSRDTLNGACASNESRAHNGSLEKSWYPDASADTYAKINSRFEDTSYQYIIKRPQVIKPSDRIDEQTCF